MTWGEFFDLLVGLITADTRVWRTHFRHDDDPKGGDPRMSEGSTTVGSIIGYLRLDRSDWDRELVARAAAPTSSAAPTRPSASTPTRRPRSRRSPP
jgi:hypothetical protein